MWPVSMLYARSLLAQRGVEAQVCDTWPRVLSRRALCDGILDAAPTYLFVETRSPTAGQTLELVHEVRSRAPSMVIWGIGQHASEKPEDFLFSDTPFDGCVCGEIEPVVPRIVDCESGIDGTATWDADAGVVVRHGKPAQLDDLDSLPLLDPRGLELDRYRMLSLHVPSMRKARWGYLLSSRGCAYRCIFCSPALRQSYGARFRGQSPERVADEMSYLHLHHGVDAFYFTDDLFTGDRERVLGICETLRRRALRVRWTIQTRMDHLDDELLTHLRAAGCVGVKAGIESGSARVSKVLRKNLDPDHVLHLAERMRRIGIHLTACFMIGNPSETAQEMEETFLFASRIGALMIQVAYHTPYPGSASYEQYAEQLETSRASHFDGVPANLSAVSDEDLIRFHRNFYLRYYLAPRQLVRYARHRALYKMLSGEELWLVLRTLAYLAQATVRRRMGEPDAHPLET